MTWPNSFARWFTSRRRRNEALAAAAAVLALAAWAFWQRYSLLASTPYPVGVDGYFYPIQLRSLLEHGTLHYPSAPLALWLMAPLAALTDPITGAKLGAALGGTLAVVPVYFLGRRAGGSFAAGFLSATLVASSAASIYATTEFVKSVLGVTVAAVYLCALARAIEPRPIPAHPRATGETPHRRLVRVGLVASFFLAVMLTHKIAVLIALAATIPVVLAARRQRIAAWPWRGLVLAAAAVLAAILVLGLLAPGRFVSPADLALLADAFTAEPDFTLPALALPGQPPLVLQHEVAVAALVALLALAAWLAEARLPGSRQGSSIASSSASIAASDRALFVGPAALALLAALPWLDVSDPQGPAFRLRLIGFLGLALGAAVLVRVLLGRLGPGWRTACVVPFAVAFLLARPAWPRDGVVQVHPAMQAAVRALRGVVPRDHTIIVPERHVLFMTVWYTGSRAALRPERVEPEQRWRLLPMAFMSPALRDVLARAAYRAPPALPRPRSLHPRHPHGLVLVPEVTWQWILGELPPAERDHYQRWSTI